MAQQAKKESFLQSKAFKNIMAKAYGIGASIVIIGALFKILHWPGANIMLIVGLGTEALIFFISAFEPQKEEVDWTLVYPELAGGEKKERSRSRSKLEEVDELLKQVKLETATFQGLKTSIEKLTQTAQHLGDISQVVTASKDLAENMRKGATETQRYAQAVHVASQTVEAVGEAAGSTKEYVAQLQNTTHTLKELNRIYDAELSEVKEHLDAMSKYHGALSRAIANIAEAEPQTAEVKEQLQALRDNLARLNTLYGNMINAMRAAQ